MKRLCSYIVKTDSGLAPNPFYGYCTLAVCTPNHMGIKLQKDDWVAGFLNKKRNYRLLYAMKVLEILHFNDYYTDSRFKKKIPKINGSWKEKCGDNFYFKDSKGKWKKHRSHFHDTEHNFIQDLKHPNVFIAKRYYYFGENAVDIPCEFEELIVKRQGVKCKHDEEVVDGFISWLEKTYKPGIHGNPVDNPHRDKDQKVISTCNKMIC